MLVLRKEGGEGGRKKGKKVENFKSNCTTGYRKILNHELKLVEGKNSEEKFIEVPKVGIGYRDNNNWNSCNRGFLFAEVFRWLDWYAPNVHQ